VSLSIATLAQLPAPPAGPGGVGGPSPAAPRVCPPDLIERLSRLLQRELAAFVVKLLAYPTRGTASHFPPVRVNETLVLDFDTRSTSGSERIRGSSPGPGGRTALPPTELVTAFLAAPERTLCISRAGCRR
jgi:hypothetical protein